MKITPIQKPSPVPFGTHHKIKTGLRYVAKHCAACGVKFDQFHKVTIDHGKSRTHGGISDITNYIAECEHCNCTLKGSMDFSDFMRKYPWVRPNFIKYFHELRGKIIDGVNYSQEITRRFL